MTMRSASPRYLEARVEEVREKKVVPHLVRVRVRGRGRVGVRVRVRVGGAGLGLGLSLGLLL